MSSSPSTDRVRTAAANPPVHHPTNPPVHRPPTPLWSTLGQDLRHGLRLLRRSPGFAAISILTIALGIGATSAIFSVINAVALKPLMYPRADRLVYITSQFTRLHFDKFWVSPPEFFELRERTKTLANIGAYRTTAVNVSEGPQPERVSAVAMTANMFDVLGVKMRLGAAFTEAQDRPNAEPVVILSDALWRRTFGADEHIVGKRIQVQGRTRTVVGVAPPDFDLHDAKAQIWFPMGLDAADRKARGSHYLYLVGRLKDGVTPTAATADLANIVRQWGTINPGTHVPNDSTHRLQMAPLRDEVIGNIRRTLWILQGAVLLVLLIACANVANLLLVRAESRHKEFAVRTALGAARGRILAQFFAEGLLLTVVGAALGLGIAQWGIRALLAANPNSIPRSAEIGVDPWVLAVTTLVAVGTALIFGLAPLLHLGADTVAAVIKEGGARNTASMSRHQVRRALVAAEIALAVMLVVGAGLLVRSFRNLTSVDAGFDPRHLVTFGFVLPQGTYAEPQRRAEFVSSLERRLQSVAGVERVAVVAGLPPLRDVNANDTDFEGIPRTPAGPIQNVDYYQATTVGYFDAMKIPIVHGRGFESGDLAGSGVAVINETMAKTFYPRGDAIGHRVRSSGGDKDPWFTIVGIAKDVKQGGLDQKVGTELYFNIEQGPRINGQAYNAYNVVVRSPLSLAALAPGIRNAVRAMDPALPIIQLRTMDDVFGESVTRQRFLSQLLTIFGVVALILAAIGTYGVVSYIVTEREREIGIRVALGAGSGQVVGLVLRLGLGLAMAGVAVGVVGAFAATRLASSLLFGVSPTDPATYLSVAAVISVVALVACLVPARRATRVDPLTAIRGE